MPTATAIAKATHSIARTTVSWSMNDSAQVNGVMRAAARFVSGGCRYRSWSRWPGPRARGDREFFLPSQKLDGHDLALSVGEVFAELFEQFGFLFLDVVLERLMQHFGVRFPHIGTGVGRLRQSFDNDVGEVVLDHTFVARQPR